MVQLFLDGGGFMWPILIVFIFGLAFVIERIYHLLKGMATDLPDENEEPKNISENNQNTKDKE